MEEKNAEAEEKVGGTEEVKGEETQDMKSVLLGKAKRFLESEYYREKPHTLYHTGPCPEPSPAEFGDNPRVSLRRLPLPIDPSPHPKTCRNFAPCSALAPWLALSRSFPRQWRTSGASRRRNAW